jgi:hypothetical protein
VINSFRNATKIIANANDFDDCMRNLLQNATKITANANDFD